MLIQNLVSSTVIIEGNLHLTTEGQTPGDLVMRRHHIRQQGMDLGGPVYWIASGAMAAGSWVDIAMT